MEQTLSVAAVAETMIAHRRRLFIGFALGYGVWVASRIVTDLLPAFSPWREDVIGVGLLGWVVWTISLVRFYAFIKALKGNPPVAAVLRDEMAQQAHTKAMTIAFGVLLVVQGVILALASFFQFPARASADASILIGVEAYLVAFLVLERG